MTAAVDVSVIVAAWRAEAFIEKAIQSALASTGVVVEVIAVDDASPDRTFEVLTRVAERDPRVSAIRLSQNSGPSAARNRAIEVARGRYVAVLDADDAMLPDRLAQLVTLADTTNADIAVDNMTSVDEVGVALASNPFLGSAEFAVPRDITLETWIKHNSPMAGGDTLGYLKPLIRRSTLVESGVRYDTALRNSEDYYLVADLLAAKARMAYIPSAGYLYTRSSGSTSYRLKPEQTLAWLAAEKQFVGRHEKTLTAQERSALATRGRVLLNVNQLVQLTDAMKSRQILKSARLLASDLRSTTYTLGTLAKVAAKKALGRRSA